MSNKYFVWVNGLRGPEAQTWDDKQKYKDGKLVVMLTPPIALLENDNRTLDELKEAFSYEACLTLNKAKS